MAQRFTWIRDWLARRVAGTTRQEHDEAVEALAAARAQFEDLAVRHHETEHEAEQFRRNPFLSWSPPGHYYSAIPDLADLRARGLDAPPSAVVEVPGVDLRPEAQLRLFAEIEPLIDVPLVTDDGSGDHRFAQPNGSFDCFDAAICSAILRHLQPARVIEVGSGHSSALILDLAERHIPGLQLTCIEPYPEVLQSLLRTEDVVEVLDRPVQDVPTETFGVLGDGDVLFIDSTHVAKAGSDVVDLFGRIVPSLHPGVVVHVHDIGHPFDYPWNWIAEGRAWNEAYLLRAFLGAGSDFEVLFFNSWFGRFHADAFSDPQIAAKTQWGGSIWLRRKR